MKKWLFTAVVLVLLTVTHTNSQLTEVFPISDRKFFLPGEGIMFRTIPSGGYPGTPGNAAFDANYLYLCIAEDTWVRVTLGTHPKALRKVAGGGGFIRKVDGGLIQLVE